MKLVPPNIAPPATFGTLSTIAASTSCRDHRTSTRQAKRASTNCRPSRAL